MASTPTSWPACSPCTCRWPRLARAGWLAEKRILGALVSLAGCGLAAGMLALTQTRGGWIGAAAGLAVLAAAWAAGKMSRRARVGALLLVLLLGTAILGIGAYFGRAKLAGLLDSTGNATGLDLATNQLSLAGRVEIWSRAIYAIEDFPFTGCGLGAFRRVAPLLYPLFLVGPETDMAHAHNIFLQIALDLGLPRLVAYLAVLATAAVAAWQTARRSQGVTQAVALGLLAGLVALHVYGLADAIALGSKPGLVFWVALGLLAARLETDKVNEVSVGVVPSSALGPLHAREQLGKPPAGATDPVDS